jgi:hypothetical protein
VTFLSDASASHDLEGIAAHDVHRSISAVMRAFADVMDTQAWVTASAPFRPVSTFLNPSARQ